MKLFLKAPATIEIIKGYYKPIRFIASIHI